MSVKNFLDEVIEEKGITFAELAKDLDVPLKTIYNVRTSKVEMPSRRFLTKISDYLHEEPYLIVYKSLVGKDISRNIDESSLMYLCEKYSEGLGIEIRNNENNFLFCGAHYKLRTFNSYSLVDGWDYLEFQFWKEQFSVFEYDISKKSQSYPKNIFLNDDVYYCAVLQYGISKAQKFKSHKTLNYELIFRNKEIYDRIQKILPSNKCGFNVNLILKPIEVALTYDTLIVDDEDEIWKTYCDDIKYELNYIKQRKENLEMKVNELDLKFDKLINLLEKNENDYDL